MPASPITRQRTLARDTPILGFTGTAYVESYVFDATSLVADSSGLFTLPMGTLVTRAVATDTTKIKAYQALGTNVNEVQTITITGTPTGGTFTLTFSGQTTAPIAYNASAATVQAALTALSNIGTGNLAGGGGALPGTAVTATFQGALASAPQALMTASGAGLTGGASPAVAVTRTTPGQTAESIIGVYADYQRDFFGNTVAADEAVPIYNALVIFDSTKIQNWTLYGTAARAALPLCKFVP